MDSIEQSTRAYSQLKPAALAILSLGVIVAQVDTSVVNLAVQPIGGDLKASVTELQWVVDAYNLVYAALLISGGLFADLYGRRLMFMIGCAVFALASLGCAFASTIAILIAARALTGFGSALLLPASLSLIRVIYRDEKIRARALGMWAGCNGMALAIGPSLGGFLIRDFGWRSVFFVVIPIALVAATAARLFIPESADRQGRSFDMPGQLLGIASLTLLTLTAIESSHLPPLWTALLAIAGALLLLLFVIVEKRLEQTALVPISMFSGGQFRSAMAGTAAMTFGMYGTLFLFPLASLGLGRLAPVEVGLSLLPMALSFIAISPFSGSITEQLGKTHTISAGLALMGLGNLLLGSSFLADWFIAEEIGLLLTGVGMGMATGPLTAVAVSTVTADRAGTASALINVARMVGATIGVALLGAIFAFLGEAETAFIVAMSAGGSAQLLGSFIAWCLL
ncbi:MFS transporter (plasmid) [Rhizobium leguminosarum]|jgi:EmrB/QacA subfamily drug resistance transporter|uniref:MFS transporter n=1 Tax=Rhizobium leguminosarum TaxID=384 RepID=UPI000DE41953|nr:MFS transporter [Rhizobium leguminosarum]MBA8830735.1 EmrB/QacA subfamily drug resistance transporter [Rhizobium leguminosarum]MDH6274715.1 DHA2 family methylenomycin A resistance protein-like MFS transporter [Rhizobium leguminosarum]MVO91649.1 MFS transporter [Rhizobium leguminosarum bv. phaseoli]TAU16161.1 MFS transporter [Rhizobium leguminosarum]TAU36096.1 MFS transporter [Rhizobium leguminosarum]